MLVSVEQEICNAFSMVDDNFIELTDYSFITEGHVRDFFYNSLTLLLWVSITQRGILGELVDAGFWNGKIKINHR